MDEVPIKPKTLEERIASAISVDTEYGSTGLSRTLLNRHLLGLVEGEQSPSDAGGLFLFFFILLNQMFVKLLCI